MTTFATFKRCYLVAAMLTYVVVGAMPMAHAQAWPTKPVTLVVGTPAGGAIDAYARTLADHLTRLTGGTFLVDNRAGASGNISASTHFAGLGDLVDRQPQQSGLCLFQSWYPIAFFGVSTQRAFETQHGACPLQRINSPTQRPHGRAGAAGLHPNARCVTTNTSWEVACTRGH